MMVFKRIRRHMIFTVGLICVPVFWLIFNLGGAKIGLIEFYYDQISHSRIAVLNAGLHGYVIRGVIRKRVLQLLKNCELKVLKQAPGDVTGSPPVISLLGDWPFVVLVFRFCD